MGCFSMKATTDDDKVAGPVYDKQAGLFAANLVISIKFVRI